MIPRRVELTNFLSFGERQTLEFTDDEPLWVLCGANGVGKSAVFDAMTFALFGSHRGGSQNAEELIRHGANSFLVVFEFEFNTTRYEVHRGRTRRTPVQRVRRQMTTGWEDIDLSCYSDRDKVRAWAVATLGLDYNAFTASVMLRQGEADRIITAQPRERHDFLCKIIGAERYKQFHNRIQQAATNLRGQVVAVSTELDRIPEVTPEQLDEAATQLQQAAERLTQAQAERDAALVRIEQARRWNDLERQRADLQQQLRDADTRAAEAEHIQRDHERYVELNQVLPVAQALLGLRDQLLQFDNAIVRLTEQRNQAVAARDQANQEATVAREKAMDLERHAESGRRELQRLQEHIALLQRQMGLVDEVARLDQLLAQFAGNLDEQLAAYQTQVNERTAQQRAASERRATALGLLQAAEQRRRDFESVEVGVRCSRCGQPVSEEHARRERAELDAEITRLRTDYDQAQQEEKRVIAEVAQATTAHKRLADDVRERDRVRERLDVLRQNLAIQGVVADPGAMRATLQEREQQLAALNAQVASDIQSQQTATTLAEQHHASWRQLTEQARRLEEELNTALTARAGAIGQRDTLFGQLPPAWAERIPALTIDELARDQNEFDHLRRSDIAGRYRQLLEDAARRDEWNRRLEQLRTELAQFPPAAWCPVADAEAAVRIASQNLAEAQQAYTAARDRENQLRGDADRRRERSEHYRELDRQYRLHTELAQLLGPQGLQRDLVRSAERSIVRYANVTLRNLSRGDLTIELDDAEDGPDRALALRVRRADDPSPIGVQFLSGSQKFRVAVSVALAIGRFAAGQTRPLQSVIIDEGFGSLDRDGLQAMGDELRNLQQSQSLRRLILVSHQEEFTARFPVGYLLQASVNGTLATPFRREIGSMG